MIRKCVSKRCTALCILLLQWLCQGQATFRHFPSLLSLAFPVTWPWTDQPIADGLKVWMEERRIPSFCSYENPTTAGAWSSTRNAV
ncbi:hypothetical protein F5Y17DRAFT_450451, partial [Xylariaceae sp. FL0594]